MNSEKRTVRSAAAWLQERDEETRVILRELQTAAARAAALWAAAIGSLGTDDDETLRLLTELEVLLEHTLRVEVDDLLPTVIEGSGRLDQSRAECQGTVGSSRSRSVEVPTDGH